MEKICKHCGETTSDFSPDKRSTDGLASACRPCRRDKQRAVYAAGNPNMDIPEKITCSKCEETKPVSEYYTDKRRATGHQSQCKSCQKEWRDGKGPEYHLWRAARHRARMKGLPFTIEPDDIIIPETCPAIGIVIEKGIGKLHAGSPSLDRIKPELGYVPGNTAVISHRANSMKQDASIEELEKLYKWLLTQGG